MSRLKNIKVNVPKIALEDYFWVIAGVPKSGKTSLFAKACELYFGNPEEAMLIAFEKGYQALKIKAADVADWDDFEEIVDDLVESKEELGIKFLGLDTVDVMMEMATDAVIKEWNAKNSGKRTNDIAGVGARGNSTQGFGVGYQLVKKKVRTAVDRLMKAGYGIMALTHSKDKKVTQKDGLEFDQLALSLSSSGNEIFVNMADFVLFLTIEKEKVGKGIETKRYMWWRGNDYITAGSRFQNVPDRIEYSIDGFLSTFNAAVQAEFDAGVDVESLKQEQAAKREEAAQKFIEEEKAKSNASDLHAELTELIQPMDKKVKDSVVAYFKEILGTANYTKIDDVELLKQALEYVKEVASV